MRNLFPAKIEHIGTYQIGVRSYYVQRYYPAGSGSYYVYVFRKGDPSARGIVFEDESDFFDWADNAPRQMELFQSEK